MSLIDNEDIAMPEQGIIENMTMSFDGLHLYVYILIQFKLLLIGSY